MDEISKVFFSHLGCFCPIFEIWVLGGRRQKQIDNLVWRDFVIRCDPLKVGYGFRC